MTQGRARTVADPCKPLQPHQPQLPPKAPRSGTAAGGRVTDNRCSGLPPSSRPTSDSLASSSDVSHYDLNSGSCSGNDAAVARWLRCNNPLYSLGGAAPSTAVVASVGQQGCAASMSTERKIAALQAGRGGAGVQSRCRWSSQHSSARCKSVSLVTLKCSPTTLPLHALHGCVWYCGLWYKWCDTNGVMVCGTNGQWCDGTVNGVIPRV